MKQQAILNTKLIEFALQLTWKKMDDICFWDNYYWAEESIEKFCYYLLSPEFIGKYCEIDDIRPSQWIVIIWWAIYKYQSDNEEPLISLLSKICIQDKKESTNS